MVRHSSWTDCPNRVRAPITVMPISTRISAYSVWAWPAFSVFTSLILWVPPRPSIPRMTDFTTQRSGRRLLRNPYPAFANSFRDRLQLRMHAQLRQDVLHVSSDRVRRHPQGFRNRLVVVAQRQLKQHFEL